MRALMFVLVLLGFGAAGAQASAQPIVTRDPAAFAATLRETMAVSGITPLRSTFHELMGANLSANIEAALLTYERSVTSPRAVVSRVTEDVALAETFRSIYLYHYYGETVWIHTRIDFVRISEDGEWAISSLSFGSEWSSVALATTPGFRPATRR